MFALVLLELSGTRRVGIGLRRQAFHVGQPRRPVQVVVELRVAGAGAGAAAPFVVMATPQRQKLVNHFLHELRPGLQWWSMAPPTTAARVAEVDVRVGGRDAEAARHGGGSGAQARVGGGPRDRIHLLGAVRPPALGALVGRVLETGIVVAMATISASVVDLVLVVPAALRGVTAGGASTSDPSTV